MEGTSEVTRLVRASANGDEAAWNALVRRYAPLVMAVIRSYRLAATDAQDVSQTVWLRLVEHLSELREPEALPRWLTTTAQRESSRHVQRLKRVLPVDPHCDGVLHGSSSEEPGAEILRAELHQALRDGLAELPPKVQSLLRLFAADPPKSYKEISQLTGMPIGSIGPTLRRCLKKLRDSEAMHAYLAAAAIAEKGGGGDWHELVKVDR